MFERKILRIIIYGPCIDSSTGEWRSRHNEGSVSTTRYNKENWKRKLMWIGHAWRKNRTCVYKWLLRNNRLEKDRYRYKTYTLKMERPS